MSETQDTEIVLGTGKLLGIFFVLVVICGSFFGLGYTFGRSSGPMTLQNGQASTLASSSGAKPGAGVSVVTPAIVETPPSSTADPNTAANVQVEQVPPSAAVGGDENNAPNRETATTKDAVPQTAPRSAAPELDTAITVQVAAVTKQEDAQVLVAALRRKNYPVFVSPNATSDSLYHVQVGPFAELKDAEAMKSKLAGDGYNPIIKK